MKHFQLRLRHPRSPPVGWGGVEHAKNSYYLKQGQPENVIHGIIRLDAIDRSQPPSYGSIQKYINDLEKDGIHVENRDLGFELSNVTTDKFVAGAQEVEMYYFSTHKDRDNLEYRKKINGIDVGFRLNSRNTNLSMPS